MPDISLERVDEETAHPRLNVVFIHGLSGNATTYWCHEGGKEGGYYWLTGLAEDLPGTAVWSLAYPADKASWGTGWPVSEAATAVLDKLMSSREFRATGDAPIALICHSLGGIIAKKLVVNAHLDRGQQPKKGKFLDRIAGIVFLATPHGGSIYASIASTAHWFISKTMGDLTSSNAALLELNHSYRDRIANDEAIIRHRVYFEGVGVWGVDVVTATSADPGLPGVRPIKVNRDHMRIQKPVGKNDVVYEGILAFLQDDVLQPRPASVSQKLDELLRRTAQVEAIPVDALRAILVSMGELADTLDAAQVGEKLKAKATEFNALTDQLNRLSSDDPEVLRLRQEAAKALGLGKFPQAEAYLAAAEARDLDGIEELEVVARQKRLSAAQSRAERAAAARLRANTAGYREAASHFSEAARIAHAADPRVSRDYKQQEGQMLIDVGTEFALNSALVAAVEHFRGLFRDISRNADPLQWAAMQGNLGNALQALGERENGTEQLEEAILAYRVALEERTRARVPLDWAKTQNNLGNALSTLGVRESGTAHLEEAVAAFRAALGEWTRERMPLDWAGTLTNLGNALQMLGERESGTARLEEAVAAHRAALEERTRERVPLDWAGTLTNLGNALARLGERESGTAQLENAVAAYRAALEEYTRERTPLHWATTQTNLGSALARLGERESGTERLKEAVAAFRTALEERTRERVPLDWAGTQNNLGNALQALGARESGTARLEEAVAAYRAALVEYPRESLPLYCAMTLGNEGVALRIIAERTKNLALAERALQQIEMARDTFEAAGHAPNAADYTIEADLARTLIRELRGGR